MRTRRGLLIIAIVLTPFLVGMLFTFQVIRFPFPTDMTDSPGVGYQEGPRRAAPEAAVPIQGDPVIPEELPENPIAADAASLQRGRILFDLHCALCHGEAGRGDGPLASHFSRTPEDLVGKRAAAEFDASVYLVLQQGFGQMPPLTENLTVRERWDVINYVRTLPGGGE